MLGRTNIHLVVRDAPQTDLPNGSIGIVFLSACAGYLSIPCQRKLHGEFPRIGKPVLVASHFVGIGDHNYNFDSSVTIFNYLKFAPRQWR